MSLVFMIPPRWSLSQAIRVCDSGDLPKLVRLGARGFAVVEAWHVFNLRCGDIHLPVRSPAQCVWPEQTLVRDDCFHALVVRVPSHDGTIFEIG